MKKYFIFLYALCLLSSCNGLIEKDKIFVISGKVYHNCAKSPYANKPLEVIKVEYGYSKTITTVGTATTGTDGSFSISYEAVTSNEIALRIPDNPAINLYAPIDLHRFKGEKVENYIDKDFYISPKTDIRIRLQCGKVYTDRDTLYISQPFTNNVIHKIVAPQNNFMLDFKNGDPSFVNAGSAYGIGWSEYKKASSGVSGKPVYNFLPFRFPTCDKSPMEVVLNLP